MRSSSRKRRAFSVPGSDDLAVLDRGLVQRDERVEHHGHARVGSSAVRASEHVGVTREAEEDSVGPRLRNDRPMPSARAGIAAVVREVEHPGAGSPQRLGHRPVPRVPGVVVPDVGHDDPSSGRTGAMLASPEEDLAGQAIGETVERVVVDDDLPESPAEIGAGSRVELGGAPQCGRDPSSGGAGTTYSPAPASPSRARNDGLVVTSGGPQLIASSAALSKGRRGR